MIGEENCPFCKRSEAGEFDFMGDGRFMQIMSFEPLNPVTPGHRLFMPRAHKEIDHFGWANATGDVALMVQQYRRQDGLPPGDFNLILNGGADASQSIAHMHWHYVPRLPGDGLILPWTHQIVH